MLPFKNRLKKEKDFDRVFKKGRGFAFDAIAIRFVENELTDNRFGFIVSKKVSKKAVERNRIKRILREQVRSMIQEMKVGWDIVITPRQNLSRDDSSDINRLLKEIFKKAGILN